MYGSKRKIKNKLWTVVADSKSFEEQEKSKSEIIILTHKPKYTFLPQNSLEKITIFLCVVFHVKQFSFLLLTFFLFFSVLKHLYTDNRTVEYENKNELSYMSTVWGKERKTKKKVEKNSPINTPIVHLYSAAYSLSL